MFTYVGQGDQGFELVNFEEVTRYRDEMVYNTCTRQVPYNEQECSYETRYRNECHNVPGGQDCRTVNDNVCSNVTRYRTECSNSGSTTQCRNEGGRRVCREVPGQRVCRQVPYTERVCRNVPRRVCTNLPSRRVCENVPYSERVCRTVTRYRTEQYSCPTTVRVPYTVRIEKVANVNFEFLTDNFDAVVDFRTTLLKTGEIKLQVVDRSNRRVLVLVNKRTDVQERGEDTIYNVFYTVKFLDAAEVLLPVTSGVTDLVLYTDELSFNLGNIVNERIFSLRVRIASEGIVKMDRVFAASELDLRNNSVDSVRAILDLDRLGVLIRNSQVYNISITPSVNLERLDFEVLNIGNIETSKTFNVTIPVTME